MGHVSPAVSVPILPALSLWAQQSRCATHDRLWYLDTGLFGESCFVLRADPQGDRARLLPLLGQAPRLLWLLLCQVLSPLIRARPADGLGALSAPAALGAGCQASPQPELAAVARGPALDRGAVHGARAGLSRSGAVGLGEVQAAGPNAVRLSLLCDAQQLDLPAGQDKVTVIELGRWPGLLWRWRHWGWGLELVALQDVRGAVPQGAGHPPAAALRPRGGVHQVELLRALRPAGVVVAVGGQEHL